MMVGIQTFAKCVGLGVEHLISLEGGEGGLVGNGVIGTTSDSAVGAGIPFVHVL